MVNPNDPRENPELFANQGSPSRPPPKPEHEGFINQIKIRDEAGFRQIPVSPTRCENYKRGGGEISNQRYGSSHVENLMERKKQPVHPQCLNLDLEGYKGSLYHNNSLGGVGGRTKPIPNVRNEQRGAATPRFGVWDENSSVAADGFTHRFHQVRSCKGYVSPTLSDDGASSPNSPKGAAILKFREWDVNSSEAADGFAHIFNKAREGYVTPARSNDGASSPNRPKSCCLPWSLKRELKKL